MHPLNF